MIPSPEYRVLFAVDIQHSAGRGTSAQRIMQEAMFTALRDSLAAAQIRWDDCHRDYRGDGVRIVVPREVPKASLTHPVALELALRLRRHNALAGGAARIRLRAALHAGDVAMSDGQLIGGSLEFLDRLLEAPPAKQALDNAPDTAPLALVLSQHVYDETVGHGYPGVEPEAFRLITFTVKETTAQAWLSLPGLGAPPPAPADPPRPSTVPFANGSHGGTQRIANYQSPTHNGKGDQTVNYFTKD